MSKNTKKEHHKFFNLKDWIEKDVLLYYFISQRNIGKSTAGDIECVRTWREEGKYFIIIRNNEIEIKNYIRSARPYWKQEFNINIRGNTFYDGEEVCGYIIPLSTWHNMASGKFDKAGIIIYDEAQKRGRAISTGTYQAFNEMLFTMERMNIGLRVYMFGNYVDAWSDPYLNYWEVKRHGEIKVQEVLGKLGRVIMLTEDDYKPRDYTARNSLAFEMAKYNPDYLKASTQGGFVKDGKYSIIYPKDLQEYKYVRTFIYKGEFLDIGTFYHKDRQERCYVIARADSDRKDRKITALTTKDALIVKGILQESEIKDIADELYQMSITGKLWFTSLQVQLEMADFIASVKGRYIIFDNSI